MADRPLFLPANLLCTFEVNEFGLYMQWAESYYTGKEWGPGGGKRSHYSGMSMAYIQRLAR